ncbi:hypothetical protein KXJ72_18150 (plasmid) [Comamonas aquatica]|nr:hypothetical protein KXJ72_18150 [Comamonas aquatica]
MHNNTSFGTSAGQQKLRFATGDWMHLFGPGKVETRCRIVIDVSTSVLLAAQEWTGLKFEDIKGERLKDLAASVIDANDAHLALDDFDLKPTKQLPQWFTCPEQSESETPTKNLLPQPQTVCEVMMQDIVGYYDTPDELPEWIWIEDNASFSHVQNGEGGGVWEFMLNMSNEFTDVPQSLQPVFEAAKAKDISYLIFHQGC